MVRATCFTGLEYGPRGEIPMPDKDVEIARGPGGELAIDIKLVGLPPVGELKDFDYSQREIQRRSPMVDSNGPIWPQIFLTLDDVTGRIAMSNEGDRVIVPIARKALPAYTDFTAEYPFPSISHILKHREMRIAIPLANGDTALLRIDAGDPLWNAFLRQCENADAMHVPRTDRPAP